MELNERLIYFTKEVANYLNIKPREARVLGKLLNVRKITSQMRWTKGDILKCEMFLTKRRSHVQT